ncbi:hypothetical protein DXG01_005540 [Tephrocybe rancida]|nr:hypothetical protein DXG01_005540 [Tephrocybe rancida]
MRPLVTAFPDVDLTVTVATDGGLLQSEAFTSSHTVASSARSPCHGAEHARGAYQYFNIWRALVNGVPTIYTNYLVADASTAVNHGHGDLKGTYSRGYKHTFVFDSGFEGYTRDDFCFAASSNTWVGTPFPWAPYARTGSSVALLESSSGVDSLADMLTATRVRMRWRTRLSVWYGMTRRSGLSSSWTRNRPSTRLPSSPVATGNDKVALHSGSAPAWVFLNDIYVFGL